MDVACMVLVLFAAIHVRRFANRTPFAVWHSVVAHCMPAIPIARLILNRRGCLIRAMPIQCQYACVGWCLLMAAFIPYLH